MRVPNLKTIKGDKNFNFFFFTTEQYENGLDYSVENEVLLFQNESIEMDGYIIDMTVEDENSIYSRMNCSEETIKRIKDNDYLIVTSSYN